MTNQATNTFHAQPYDITATGFFFESAEEYAAKAATLCNRHGDPVEEFEIQLIDGEAIDCALFAALGIHQGNIRLFIEKAAAWDEWQKIAVIIAAGEIGKCFALADDDPDDLEIDIYRGCSMRGLAEEFVEEGLFGSSGDTLFISGVPGLGVPGTHYLSREFRGHIIYLGILQR